MEASIHCQIAGSEEDLSLSLSLSVSLSFSVSFCSLIFLSASISLFSPSFGILGKPHNQYSRSTLMPRWPGHDDDDDGEDDDDDDDDDSSEAHMRAKTTSFAAHRLSIAGEKSGSRSRANTVTSHATTEEPSSDTE